MMKESVPASQPPQLTASSAHSIGNPSYATGGPTKSPGDCAVTGNSVTAGSVWLPLDYNASPNWLEVTFDTPVRPTGLVVGRLGTVGR